MDELSALLQNHYDRNSDLRRCLNSAECASSGDVVVENEPQ